MESKPSPENIQRVQGFIRCLLQNLDGLPDFSRISYEEQSIALAQLAEEFSKLAQL